MKILLSLSALLITLTLTAQSNTATWYLNDTSGNGIQSQSSTASGSSSRALGTQTTASGNFSTALGNGAKAMADMATALVIALIFTATGLGFTFFMTVTTLGHYLLHNWHESEI